MERERRSNGERRFNSEHKPSRKRTSFNNNEGSEKEFKQRRPRVSEQEGRDSRRPRRESSNDRPKRRFDDNREERHRRNFDNDRPKRRFDDNREERPRRNFDNDRPKRRFDDNREERPRRNFDNDRPKRRFDDNREERPRRNFDNDRPQRRFNDGNERRPRKGVDYFDIGDNNSNGSESNNGLIRLNKYISNSGICSRREADELIAAGAVTVNGEVVTEMGYKVTVDDIVCYGGERLVNEKKKYLLLNKPKGYITTLDDPRDRKTVMMLIHNACKERLYPVGRLDRNTTGLLLFTNDGDMTKKLTHPSFGARKIYHVELDKPVSRADMDRLLDGVMIDDDITKADDIQYVGDGADKRIVGIELHSGKNRIVRKMFESLGYEVFKLDRVFFAGLTKKDLPRGNYRFLTNKEVDFLKMIKSH